ncbi:amino acid ABC transporter permease [Ammoniphilus resinae]|uniref:Polar amino acid transport system permease protein n=1 Tax=Ammoniphilus resinae TaxID=861532 RepID=A0ABS4GQM3_9BACL|nr:amino acid ABC transporter permease [Ammoniphilus resinae]MBP1932564.1 polar amino acid transport system permease protein [Ammoniphilus resinae]
MWDWSVVWDYRELFVRGFFNTILLTSTGVAFGLLIGLFVGLGKMSRNWFVRILSSIYIDVFRGTPLFVQILLIHFAVIPSVFEALNMDIPPAIFSGFVALSLNSGAYIAEIFRAGIQSIDQGQMEAARSLGMNHKQAMYHVIIPQAFKRILPPLGNEFIALLKDSSLLAVIAVNELAYAGFTTAKSTFVRFPPYLSIAVLYLFLTLIFSQVVFWLERRYKTD